MAVGSVRPDLVDDHLEAQLVRPRQDRVEVRQVAEQRIDLAIVADVVAEILHRRGEERREPDAVDAQAGDVIELFQHPLRSGR